MAAAVAADGVAKRYGETTALAGVSLAVDPGEVFSLVGPNGAGKTTLVRALTGTIAPTAGTVRVLGVAPTRLDRHRLGLLPQAFSPPARLTARELLRYYAGLYDTARPVEDVLSAVGLDGPADTWYARLSGGQQRRACVGIALINDPEVVFLDEPTTGIDPAGRRAIWALIDDLADAGTTVFLTTHYMEEAEALADRVGLLVDGELVETGSPAALIEAHAGGSRLLVETAAGDLPDLGFDAEPADGGIRLRGVEPAEIGEVVAALEADGIEYDGIRWSTPGLEDVFLALAGEAIDASDTDTRGVDA